MQFNVRLKIIIIMLIIEVQQLKAVSYYHHVRNRGVVHVTCNMYIVQCWWSSSSAWPLWQLKSCEEEDDTRDVLHFPMACP